MKSSTKSGLTSELRALTHEFARIRAAGNERAARRAYEALYLAAMGTGTRGPLVRVAFRSCRKNWDLAYDIAQTILLETREEDPTVLLGTWRGNIAYAVKKRALQTTRQRKREVSLDDPAIENDDRATICSRRAERRAFDRAETHTPESAVMLAEAARLAGAGEVSIALTTSALPMSREGEGSEVGGLEPKELKVLNAVVEMAIDGVALTVPALMERTHNPSDRAVRKYLSQLRQKGWLDANDVVVRTFDGTTVPANPRIRQTRPEHGLKVGEALALTAYVALVRETAERPTIEAVASRIVADGGHAYRNPKALVKSLWVGGFVDEKTGAVLRTIDGSEIPTLGTVEHKHDVVVPAVRKGPVRRMGHKPARPPAKVIPIDVARSARAIAEPSIGAMRALAAISALTAETGETPSKTAVAARIARDTGHDYRMPSLNRIYLQLRAAGLLDASNEPLSASEVRSGEDVAIVPTGAPPTSEKTGTDDLPVQVDVVIDGVVEDTLPVPTAEDEREIKRRRESLKTPDRRGIEVPRHGIFGKLTLDTAGLASWTSPLVAPVRTLADVVPAHAFTGVAPFVVDAPSPRGWDDADALPAWMVAAIAREVPRPEPPRLFASAAPGVESERESGSADPPDEAPDGALLVKADERRARPTSEVSIAERLLSFARDTELDPDVSSPPDEFVFPDEDDSAPRRPRVKRGRHGRRVKA